MSKQYSDEMILAARKELKKRAARVSLANFITYTMPHYQMGWFHQTICEALDKFLDDVANKRSPRLIITTAPRHGKSQIVSRHFPAYTLGRYPDFEFVGSSYSGELATEFSKNVQELMESPEFCDVFPEVKIPMKGVKANGATRQADKFKIIGKRGGYVSVGVSGSLTGRGAHVLVIDDPLKDRAEALSETVRNNVWNWYTSTAYTRLAPGGGVIVMCTRWSVDDLIGRLLDQQAKGDGDTWKVINFPAIAECDELHRKEGEALHPERYPLEALLRIKKAVGERDWNSLYQQHPIPEGGGLFKKDWIRYWNKTNLPNQFDQMIMSWDMTFKDTSKSDYVVGQVWARKGANHYLLDQVRGQWSFTKTKDMFIELCKKWPRATRKLIEDKANGPAVIAEFKEDIVGIVPVTPVDSKEARAHAVSTLWEAGNVYIPEHGKDHPWVTEFETELLSFPGGPHDDQVDSCTQALNDFNKHGGFKVHRANYQYLQTQGMLRR